MLSGNGRHRRPRQAPALLVAAGVTGSAIAIPLLGAGGASAADGTVWDKVAECETGGSWSADVGDGYFGGLHLTQGDWEIYGGLEYASSPDRASRSQQIAVAQKILAAEGPGAWPTCGLTSGLTKENGSAGLDTGVGDGSSSSGASDSPGLSDTSKNSSGSGKSSGDSSESSAEASPSPSSSSTADSSSKSDTSPGSDAGDTGVSRSPDGSPTETAEADDSDKSQQNAGSWSLVDTGSVNPATDDTADTGTGRHRGDSADESATDGAGASSGRHASYTVRVGDTLASIADSLDLDGGWSALYAENRQAIGSDPNHIFAGQTLDVPAE
ncbi:transglycosylase family protein [Streptomyces sp. HUAS ZL42]|uniref:transglycosylase family protein n=1 Tax=Streptomyces sp. HUAS ZL42 TaxID=3231715 RepID=UPI00345E1D2E